MLLQSERFLFQIFWNGCYNPIIKNDKEYAMKINHMTFTSPTALSLDLTPSMPICVLYGRHATLALDLLRELTGDNLLECDPDAVDDGRFVLDGEIEIEGKTYTVCYIRNADFMGDHRLAVNFTPYTTCFSEDDTNEYLLKCANATERPEFVSDLLDRLDLAIDTAPIFDQLLATGRQIFLAVCPGYPKEKLQHDRVQIIDLDQESVMETIRAALRGDYSRQVHAGVQSAIPCPVCGHDTYDNHAICPSCGWQYDGFDEQHYSTANRSTLQEYRALYVQALKERTDVQIL